MKVRYPFGTTSLSHRHTQRSDCRRAAQERGKQIPFDRDCWERRRVETNGAEGLVELSAEGLVEDASFALSVRSRRNSQSHPHLFAVRPEFGECGIRLLYRLTRILRWSGRQQIVPIAYDIRTDCHVRRTRRPRSP